MAHSVERIFDVEPLELKIIKLDTKFLRRLRKLNDDFYFEPRGKNIRHPS